MPKELVIPIWKFNKYTKETNDSLEKMSKELMIPIEKLKQCMPT
jgi:hypothetical protein